jgi:hypothetical protein
MHFPRQNLCAPALMPRAQAPMNETPDKLLAAGELWERALHEAANRCEACCS